MSGDNLKRYNKEYWISDSDLKQLSYSNYWNDEETERTKTPLLLEGDIATFESNLLKGGLPYALKDCINYLNNNHNRRLEGKGMDLAAGYLWAASYLFKYGDIQHLLCVEYSEHRLFKIGPKVLDYYRVPTDQVTLILGSFYDLHVEDNQLDFVFLSQALHHADDPVALLKEIYRVLKPNGILIIIGEHQVNFFIAHIKHYIKYFITKFISTKKQELIFNRVFNTTNLAPKIGEIIPPDPILGDHYYLNKDYYWLFSQAGFETITKIDHLKSTSISFVLLK